MNHDLFRIEPGRRPMLGERDTAFTGYLKDKRKGVEKLAKDVKRLARLQEMLYAQDSYSLLIVLQAMDTAGKDGIIRHVLSGMNPQGTHVRSFKAPSDEELDHDFLWRSTNALPERGGIGIFNRSYYEEVIVVRVHPELLDAQKLPPELKGDAIWQDRFEQINGFEKYLARNGTVVLKFFLHLSKQEQANRLLARIDTPEKHWKFSLRDVKEREHWDDYMSAYEDAIAHTSTEHAPWYVIPADRKWFARAAISDIIVSTLASLDLAYPTVGDDSIREMEEGRQLLQNTSKE